MTEAGLAPASDKLRTVLDYVPCEPCLARPVDDQELLCSVCRRLDRQIGVRVAVTTTVRVERPPVQPERAILIEPPTQAPTDGRPEGPVAVPPSEPAVVVRALRPGRAAPRRASGRDVEVFVRPVEEAAPPAPEPAPAAAAGPEPEAEPEPSPFDDAAWEDVASWHGEEDDLFGTSKATAPAPRAPPPREEPPPEPARAAPAEPADVPEDDFVFRPPTADVPQREPALEDADASWLPDDEIPVEPEPTTSDEESDAEEHPAPVEAEAEPVEMLPVEDDVAPLETEPVEDDVEPVEMLPVEDDVEPLETESVEDVEPLETEPVDEDAAAAPDEDAQPAPVQADSDLWRLVGFDAQAAAALDAAQVKALSHLSGLDAREVADRTGLDAGRVQPWVHVADLVTEVGVPVDAALALVAAGVDGPAGLAAADAEDVVARVEASGGSVSLREVKRWKRRA